jgi:hypothetical protein
VATLGDWCVHTPTAPPSSAEQAGSEPSRRGKVCPRSRPNEKGATVTAMMNRWCLVLAMAVAAPSLAQGADADDDELVPLGKIKAKPKPKAPARPRPKVAPAKTKVAADDELVPITPMAAKGDLLIKLAVPVSGATVSIDGKEVGTLPLSPQSVPSGERTVAVKRVGYASFVKKVLVPGGKSAEVEVRLTPVAAVLSVQSDVPGAQVLLNGRPIGVVPLLEVEVPPGPAELAVIKEGFREDAQKLNFVAGKEYPIKIWFQPRTSDVPLQASLTPGTSSASPMSGVSMQAEPITRKWYFWAGAAAVVAAAAVGVIVGVQKYTADNTLTGEKICSGVCSACINLDCSKGILPVGSF